MHAQENDSKDACANSRLVTCSKCLWVLQSADISQLGGVVTKLGVVLYSKSWNIVLLFLNNPLKS